jgi:FixJ family two-component response regulator
VLQWLSKGKTNRDIAQILGLSPRTVDKHLEQIYSKLGVENRTAAAAICGQCEEREDVRLKRPGPHGSRRASRSSR